MAADPGSMSAVFRERLPWFLKDGRILAPIGQGMDKLTQLAIDAVRLRYPSVTPSDASLSIIGRDRRIPRAPGETPESYARRLVLWLDLWALAGLPLGLLYAIQSFVFPGYPQVRLVSRSGFWYTLDEGASRDASPFEAMTLPCPEVPGQRTPRYVPALEATPRARFWMHDGAGNWDWDSISNPERAAFWWDYWLVVYPSSWPLQGTYAGSGADQVVYGSGEAWGFDEIAGTFGTMRELVRIYQRAGSNCRGVIFAPTLADFDPYAAPGDPTMPDGHWGADAKIIAGASEHTRRRDCRYLLKFPTG
jgi:hypothetical protein